jgi:hypothetical protein
MPHMIAVICVIDMLLQPDDVMQLEQLGCGIRGSCYAVPCGMPLVHNGQYYCQVLDAIVQFKCIDAG